MSLYESVQDFIAINQISYLSMPIALVFIFGIILGRKIKSKAFTIVTACLAVVVVGLFAIDISTNSHAPSDVRIVSLHDVKPDIDYICDLCMATCMYTEEPYIGGLLKGEYDLPSPFRPAYDEKQECLLWVKGTKPIKLQRSGKLLTIFCKGDTNLCYLILVRRKDIVATSRMEIQKISK